MPNQEQCAEVFVKVFKTAKLSDIVIGTKTLKPSIGVSDSIKYNRARYDDGSEIDMLSNAHEYTFWLEDKKIQMSLQLYENDRNHYRLFAFVKVGNIDGMTFSVNFKTGQINTGLISFRHFPRQR